MSENTYFEVVDHAWENSDIFTTSTRFETLEDAKAHVESNPSTAHIRQIIQVTRKSVWDSTIVEETSTDVNE